jgi:hypothetical protein
MIRLTSSVQDGTVICDPLKRDPEGIFEYTRMSADTPKPPPSDAVDAPEARNLSDFGSRFSRQSTRAQTPRSLII